MAQTPPAAVSWDEGLHRFRVYCDAAGPPSIAELRHWADLVRHEERGDVLFDLVAEHLRRCWDAGRPTRLEEYANALDGDLPPLAALPCDLIEHEFLVRHGAAGADHPGPEEYARRFPDRGDVRAALEARGLDGGRFVKVRLEGRGGLGLVWSAYDRHLRRPVAIKEPRAELAGDGSVARRLAREARVTAGLEHPSIVSVHELRATEEGRLFYVMRLVHGRTLADVIHDYHHPGADVSSAERALRWNRLLQVFAAVCEAMAYAHARGVIHRDLKPHNVMVGAFGEVQVMDWGLGKLLPDGKESPEPAAEPDAATLAADTQRRVTFDGETQVGSVLGTYAYMPPEQTRGEVDQLDRRSDVFGLGAILCEVLTGAPPYVGSPDEVRARAERGEIEPARERLRRCGADPLLVTLAEACLNRDPGDRPADASVVAKAIVSYQAEIQQRLK
jgi:hypothetical protein